MNGPHARIWKPTIFTAVGFLLSTVLNLDNVYGNSLKNLWKDSGMEFGNWKQYPIYQCTV